MAKECKDFGLGNSDCGIESEPCRPRPRLTFNYPKTSAKASFSAAKPASPFLESTATFTRTSLVLIISTLMHVFGNVDIELRFEGELIEIDSRPSDAIAVAVTCDPQLDIYVSEDVLNDVMGGEGM